MYCDTCKKAHSNPPTLGETVKHLWNKACEFDGIPIEGAVFVAFSKENPYIPFYEQALGQLRGTRPSIPV